MTSLLPAPPENKGLDMADAPRADEVDRAYEKDLRALGTAAVGVAIEAARRTGKVISVAHDVDLPCVLRAAALIMLAHFRKDTPVGVVLYALENADLPPAHIWRIK